MAPTKILVVEDTVHVSSMLLDLLESAGYQVIHAAEGKSAIEMARKERPNLVLLDVMIPEVNGFEVCRTIRYHPDTSQIKVIMYTALSRKKDMETAFAAGASEYIVKPFDNKRLLATIRDVLQGK